MPSEMPTGGLAAPAHLEERPPELQRVVREAAERVEGGGHLSHVAVPEDFRSVRFAVEVMGIRHQSGGEVAGGLFVKLLALLVAEAFEGFRVDDLPGAGRTVGGEREASCG